MRWGVLFGLLAVGCPWIVQAEDQAKPAPADVEFFNQKIRPLLAARCLECHGEEKQKAGLRLDTRAASLQGGDSGEAVVPGKPAESLLIQVIRYDSDLKMPPKSKLPDEEIALLTKWVEQGAVWPGDDEPNPPGTPEKQGPLFTADDKAFWAFQPIQDPPLPEVKHSAWPQRPLDYFILAELEKHDLQPAAPATKRTLIRRASLDLLGLPPTPEEVVAFLADESPQAFERVIERLLSSPHYGERWGRHWLDIARYADSNGLDENLAYAHAFRYRDYVVVAFNKDKPFDQFIHEQLAGDLLPATEDPAAHIERITATGFLSLGAKMLAEDDPVKMQMDIIDEQVDTIGKAFLGLTLGCARCHDHKFDPVPQADYYSLAGIFKSTKTMENFSVVARWQELPLAVPEVVEQRNAQQKVIDQQKAGIAVLMESANAELQNQTRLQAADYLLAGWRELQLADWSKAAKPVGDDPEIAQRPHVLQVEAEDYTRGNVIKDTDSYGKGIGVLVNRGELPNFVEYDFTLPEPGVYQFEIRLAAQASRPCLLLIDGQRVSSNVAGKTTGTWFPDSQKWFVEGFFELSAGKHTLRLEHPQYFPHIDKWLLAPALDEQGRPRTLPGRLVAADVELPAGLVQQWTRALEQAREKPESVFRLWHEFAGVMKEQTEAEDAHGVRALLLQDPRPESLTDLARRYGELFAAVHQEWQTAQAAAGDKPAKLADPAREALRAVLYDPEGPCAVPPKAEQYYSAEKQAELKTQREQLAALEKALPALPEAMAVSEGQPENLKVHLRGSHLTLGATAPRQFPQIIAGETQQPLGATGSGRLELAQWLTQPEHPLTSRVTANRVWLWHFGEGLVRSPDNFGRLGERPTHPELLDHLARTLQRNGWSLKALHREIMLSATYQMSSTFNPHAAASDPENRLWWHWSRQRMDAEVLRDSILAVTGGLDRTEGGSLLQTENRRYVTSTANVNPVVYQTNRRSIYLPVVRSALYEMFQAFDFADPSVLNGRRETTTVAPQALFMLNSQLVLQQTRQLAEQLLADESLDDTARITALYERILCREPATGELQRAENFLAEYVTAVMKQQQAEAPEARLRAWQALCRTLLASNEFVYVE